MKTFEKNPLYYALFISQWLTIFFVHYGFAQTISLSDTVVNFGNVNAYETHNFEIRISNLHTEPVLIENVALEEDVFYTDLEPMELEASADHFFNVYFRADHNLFYNDFLRIELNIGSRPVIIRLQAQAVYSGVYYASTVNLWDDELKSTLNDIIDGHTELSYSGLWDALKDTDEDPQNADNVILLYTGWSYAKTDNGGDVDQWNREHVWAKSHGDFDNNPPAGTDLHHLRPTDVSVNNARGNLDFDNGGELYIDGDGATDCRKDSDSWEPRLAVKGDVARMMYYMTIRYEGEEGYDLELVESVPSTSTNEPFFGKRSTLYQWHRQDTVDAWEKSRNEKIYNNWQGNRNPFIDHPEFADRIYTIHGGLPKTKTPEIAVSPVTVNFGSVGLNSFNEYFLVVINSGDSLLNISSIHTNDDSLTVDITSLTINEEDYHYIKLAYTADSVEKAVNANLFIHSNDTDESPLTIPVTAEVSGSASIIDPFEIPEGYQLLQNFPNPFNNATIINYRLPAAGEVELSVYNLLGQRIALLVSKLQHAGSHQVNFDATGLASGIYYYKIKSGQFASTRRMLLIK
ncbi:MAG: endonuclease [Calditrichaceae bacterium]|nr:endonuclease [Calditrichaceae bacterium]MBN2709295.1 endonuclease [Calditrichaceae bacterium]